MRIVDGCAAALSVGAVVSGSIGLAPGATGNALAIDCFSKAVCTGLRTIA